MTYKAATSLIEFELKKILLYKLEKNKSYRAAEQHRDHYDALVKSYHLNNDLFDSYGKAYSFKRGRKDKDKCEDPPAGSDQGLKKRKTSKDAEPPISFKLKDSKLSSSKGTKIAQAEKPFLTFDELMSTLIDFLAYVMHNLKIDNQTQQHLVGSVFDLLKGTCKRQEYPFDLSKPIPLIEVQDRQVVPA
ncbi:hypothetical protein Tco_1267911 [Tanacetum coccineum]